MKLIFVRHGQAGPYCADDAGRDLTEFGEAQARQTGEYLANNHQIDLIIASPYNRANQTARLILQAITDKNAESESADMPAFITVSSITPDDDPTIGLDDIDCAIRNKFGDDANDKTIAVVCHMPIVARMTAILDGLPPAPFALAECRCFDAPVIAPDLGVQRAAFVPAQPE
ncbi:histidine phosphatase family protein [Moraxella caviae]|uniref:Histidine phosphatase family protein n=1 Tax=Moraxella caviae TaxID=34060 RepID=A0A1S9ZV09_9GAMM|nr:phosphoglycerate mutase family protein [Moraxella caviae]OOR87304.1 histidine phosphatase family protein [Moraxella caviae]STZ14632.1 phosphohistidine phosphatase [Moraxella caviae]VEW11401.1 phosphohistidine phosphatase [Moraxella caviae]